MDRIGILKETLSITKDGKYVVDGKNVALMHPISNLKQAVYLSEKDVLNIIVEQKFKHSRTKYTKSTLIRVTNRDTFSAALAMSRMSGHIHENKIAVLNFANPVNPGGGRC